MLPTPLPTAESLEHAFQAFSEVSEHLSRAYIELEGQVERLTLELSRANSERLRTLSEKERLAHRLQDLLEALPGGVIETDGQGAIVEYNPAAAALLGEPLRGESWRRALDRASVPGAENPHQRQLANGSTLSINVCSRGDAPGQIVLLTDISELRALQDLVNQQKRLSTLGEMVASLAHQIRTPLATALLYASQLGKSELSDPQRARFAGKLTDRLQHLERQVNDMLAFARVGCLVMEAIDLRDILARVRDDFGHELADSPIEFRVTGLHAPAPLYGNADALFGIVSNLVDNAVQSLRPGSGHITLSLITGADPHHRIVVADDGPGIAEDVRPHIFEPFFTTRPNGSGLGLAVVDCVVRAHGGVVQHRAGADGRGAEFLIELPTSRGAHLLPGGFSGTQLETGASDHGTH